MKRKGLLLFILVCLGACLLSILAHALLVKVGAPERGVAEICFGEIYAFRDTGPIKQQGIWLAAPFLVRFRLGPMNYIATHTVVCGALPWLSGRQYFKWLVP